MKKIATILLLTLGLSSCQTQKQLKIYQTQNDKLKLEVTKLQKYSERLETVILEAQDSNIILKITLRQCIKEYEKTR